MQEARAASRGGPRSLDKLAAIVIEDAEAAGGRERDRAANDARRLVLEAEDRLESLRAASRDLGRVRGEATRTAREQEADHEIEGVRVTAFDALYERFQQRALIALRDLPKSDRYAQALVHWAAQAAADTDRPAEVFTARRDRAAVYEALLEAGAEDFQVNVDHGIDVGFVVRDLDGRTLLDRRPAALLDAHAAELRALLEARIEAFQSDPPAE